MSITSISTDIPGQTGVNTRLMRIVCTDSLATITTAGYLNESNLEGYTVVNYDFFHIYYGAGSASFGIFAVSIDNDGVVTLSEEVAESGVTYSGSPTINHIASFASTGGVITDDVATAINGGNIQAGLSGTAGALSSFPSTAAKGSLKIAAVANTNDTVTTISNVAMAQATTISIPDPADVNADFVVSPSPLVSGNLIKASGTAGLVVDAGKILAGTTAAFGGGGVSNAFTVTGLTAASVGAAAILTSANTASIIKSVPNTNTLTVTFSADPGAGTTLTYIYATAPMS